MASLIKAKVRDLALTTQPFLIYFFKIVLKFYLLWLCWVLIVGHDIFITANKLLLEACRI